MSYIYAAHSDNPGDATGPRGGTYPSSFAALAWCGFGVRDLVPGMLGQEGAGKGKDELLKKGALG